MEDIDIMMVNCIASINEMLKSEIENSIVQLLTDYDIRDKVSWRYECHKMQGYFEVLFDIIFLKRSNEDNYGVTLSFQLNTTPQNINIQSDIIRSDGPFILFPRNTEYAVNKDIEDIIYEMKIVTKLLVKDYILDTNNGLIS